MKNKEKTDGYWFCPSCSMELGWYHVTNEECCNYCGSVVEWIDKEDE